MESIYVIDGRSFRSLSEFARHFSAVFGDPDLWNGNLDALNDILRGGFGTPEDGFVLRWTHVNESRRALGHAATAAWLEERIEGCHPSNVPAFTSRQAAAQKGEGPTLFDEIVQIIRSHGPTGSESRDGVLLELSEDGG